MTTIRNNVLCSWSGGKDSCFALMEAVRRGYTPRILLNVLNEEGKISRSHGIPAPLLQSQAAAAGLPIAFVRSSWAEYESNFTSALTRLKDEYSVDTAVFGDIDLEAHRDWEEKVCRNAGLNALLPLWKMDRGQLVLRMLDQGIETMIVSCNAAMGPDFLGRILDEKLVQELVSRGIDPCGENGEYHTLVLNCPLFANPIHAVCVEKQEHDGYWFAALKGSL